MNEEEFLNTALELVSKNIFEFGMGMVGIWRTCTYCRKETSLKQTEHLHEDTCKVMQFTVAVVKRYV